MLSKLTIMQLRVNWTAIRDGRKAWVAFNDKFRNCHGPGFRWCEPRCPEANLKRIRGSRPR